MDQIETEDTLETEAELSTSGEPPTKKRKSYPVEKSEILKMTEEDLRELIEAMSTDEEEDDSSDSSDSDFDLGESEENEDDDSEDVELGTRWDDISSNPLTTPMTSISSIADSKSHEIAQPECSKFSTIGSFNLKAKGNSPRDFFNLMANERFLDLVITETNKQAKEVNLTKSSIKLGEWKDLSKVEFETFLGLLFHMGTIRTNHLNDYWKKTHLFYLKCISNHMRRDRFLAILKFLNFAEIPHDYDQMHDDKLYKIKPLLDIFHENVSNFESSVKELSGGESMVLWRGHLVFCQFKKNKRHRYGIKLYKLTEPSGLVLRLLVYICSANEPSGKKNMDEFAHRLEDDQWENQIIKYSEVSSEKVTRYKEKPNWNDEENCVLKWKDKREVMMVNTEFGAGLIDVPNRRLAEYNRFKGNIYSSDQFMAYYPLERRAMKWYKKLGIHIFQMMLLNSYFLYRKFRDPKVTLYEFRLKVIDSLLPLNASVFPCPPSPKAIIRHFPDLLTVGNSSRRKQKRCRVCYKKGIRRRITIFCPDCPEEPGLCLRPCFLEYHEKMFSLNE